MGNKNSKKGKSTSTKSSNGPSSSSSSKRSSSSRGKKSRLSSKSKETKQKSTDSKEITSNDAAAADENERKHTGERESSPSVSQSLSIEEEPYAAPDKFKKKRRGKFDEERSDRTRLLCEYWRRTAGSQRIYVPMDLARMISLYSAIFFSFGTWPSLSGTPFKLDESASSVAIVKTVKRIKNQVICVGKDPIPIKDTIHDIEPVFLDIECVHFQKGTEARIGLISRDGLAAAKKSGRKNESIPLKEMGAMLFVGPDGKIRWSDRTMLKGSPQGGDLVGIQEVLVLDWTHNPSDWEWSKHRHMIVSFKIDGKFVSIEFNGKRITTFDLRTMDVFREDDDIYSHKKKITLKELYPFVSFQLVKGSEFKFLC